MIQKTGFAICFLLITLVAAAQRNHRPPTYSPDNRTHSTNPGKIFIGGGLNLGFASNTFAIGALPEVGYSIAEWLDAGVSINLNYISERADPYYNYNVRSRNFNYGGGPFLRFYPVHFIMAQAQFETNWIHVSQYDFNYNQSYSTTVTSSSFLVGAGYSQRVVGQSSFYTLIMLDLKRDLYSPYRDYNNSAIPIIRTGFNFYLRAKPKKEKSDKSGNSL